MANRYLTTGDIAKLCDVTPNGVIKWITSGKLTAFRTPGGQRRVREEDLRVFLKKFNYPVTPVKTGTPSQPVVLCVDDDPDVILLYKKIFAQKGGWTVHTAGNGYDACIKASALQPSLILLDIMMPYVDGYEVYRRLKSNPYTCDLNILIITGTAKSDVIQVLGAEVEPQIIEKPIDLSALMQRIGHLIEAKI